MRWRDIEQEPPTLADANQRLKVVGQYPDESVLEIHYCPPWWGIVAWMPYSELPKFKRKEAHDEQQPRSKD